MWIDPMGPSVGRVGFLILLASAVAGLSWAALTYLPRAASPQTASVEIWENRIQQAAKNELPLVFQSLFQVQNDRVIDLGVNYLLSADQDRRQAAATALQDSLLAWKNWEHSESRLHIERVAQSLAKHVAMFNQSEQETAVEVARQFLLWPTVETSSSQTSLLLHCQTIFRTARTSYAGPVNGDDSNVQRAVPSMSASDQVARDLLRETSPSFVPRSPTSAGTPAFSVGYRKSVRRSEESPAKSREPIKGDQQLLAEDLSSGSSMGVRSLDPSTLDLPGGLIPVPVAEDGDAQRLVRSPEMGQPLPEGVEESPDRVTDIIRERRTPTPSLLPGNTSGMAMGDPSQSMAPRRLSELEDQENRQQAVRPLRETMQRQIPSFDTQAPLAASPSQLPLNQIPGRNDTQWQRPDLPLRRWSHIDVMRLLQSSSDEDVDRAERELRDRGFSRHYISVAYRLTSDDPLERYNLVLELPQLRPVEPLPFLKWLSRDEHPEVRTAAMQQLSQMAAGSR